MKGLQVLIFTAAAAVSACATSTVGHNFNAEAVTSLQPEKTTVAEARALLGGAPTQTVKADSGKQVMVWQFIQAKAVMGSVSNQVRQVTLAFNPEGVMERVVSTINIPLSPDEQKRLRVQSATVTTKGD